MHRLAAVIVLLFAFASLAGATTAHAHRYVSTPMLVLNHVDANNRPIPVIVAVQRGQIDLGSGLLMPCGQHHAIPITVAQLPVCPVAAGPIAGVDPIPAGWVAPNLLRPPRQA